jgi:MFS transporter, PAT family, beta-lactamase induction signal transducer AmpG
MLVTLFLGFSSGVPFAATLGTLQAWMKDAAVDLTIISFYASVRLPYTLKFIWAPLMDRFVPPFLGRRRGWMVITQVLLALSLGALGLCDPKASPFLVAFIALLICFFSASQDIVLDAHRRDSLNDQELGLGSSLFIAGYRLGMLFAGGFAFYLADHIPWSEVYFVLGASILVGLLATLAAPEPTTEIAPPRSLREAVIGPLKDYFGRSKAWEILAFILLYKLGDNLAGAVSTYFVLDLGFTKTEYFAIVKTFGLLAMIVGGLIGGGIILRIGINNSLWLFGILQAVSLLGFSVLADLGHNQQALTTVIVLETLAIGMGTSAYAAFMASQCNRKFSATQYALLTSLMGIPGVILATPTGYLAEYLGWKAYFLFCAAMALPGYLLLFRVAPWGRASTK